MGRCLLLLLLLPLLLGGGHPRLQRLNRSGIDMTTDLLCLCEHGEQGRIRLSRRLHASRCSRPSVAKRIRLGHGVLPQDRLLLDLLRRQIRVRCGWTCSIWHH